MSFLERLDCSQALGGRNGKETRVVDVKQPTKICFIYLPIHYLFIYLFICLFIHSFVQSLIN